MNKPYGVFISGTGGTGSTLMRRLFMSFEECKVIHQELRPDDFITIMLERRRIVTTVATRGTLSVFSHPLPEKEIGRQLKMFKDNSVGILVMARDFEAATASRSGSIAHRRWVGAYSAVFKYWRHVKYLCNYYRLVAEPNVVQGEIARTFGLKIVHKFSEYPDFCKGEVGTEHEGNPQHTLRRIGEPYGKGV